jgi:hypothetical protein
MVMSNKRIRSSRAKVLKARRQATGAVRRKGFDLPKFSYSPDELTSNQNESFIAINLQVSPATRTVSASTSIHARSKNCQTDLDPSTVSVLTERELHKDISLNELKRIGKRLINSIQETDKENILKKKGTKFVRAGTKELSYEKDGDGRARQTVISAIEKARDLSLLASINYYGWTEEEALAKYSDSSFHSSQIVTLTYRSSRGSSYLTVREDMEDFCQNLAKLYPKELSEYSSLLVGNIERTSNRKLHVHVQLFCPELAQNYDVLHGIVQESWKHGHFYIGPNKNEGQKRKNCDSQAALQRIASYAYKKDDIFDENGCSRQLLKSASQIIIPPNIRKAIRLSKITIHLPTTAITNSQIFEIVSFFGDCTEADLHLTELSKYGNSFSIYVSKIKDYVPNAEMKRFRFISAQFDEYYKKCREKCLELREKYKKLLDLKEIEQKAVNFVKNDIKQWILQRLSNNYYLGPRRYLRPATDLVTHIDYG